MATYEFVMTTEDGAATVYSDDVAQFCEAMEVEATGVFFRKSARVELLGEPKLSGFEWFEIMPCRTDESEGGTVLCEAGEVEFWSIYGRKNEGTAEAPEYLASAVHDGFDPLELVRIARQIALKTGKGFLAGDIQFGQYPKRNGQCVPVVEFTEIAEDLTFAIHEDNENNIHPDDQRDDDFDCHPLAELREAFVSFSDYSGSDQLDPFKPLEGQTKAEGAA